MRRWLIPVIIATLAAVAGCGSGSDCASNAQAASVKAPPAEAVVVVTVYGSNIVGSNLDCDPALKSLELGVGKQTGTGSEYSITEHRTKEAYGTDYQDNVTLHVQPPAGVQVLGAIVFSPLKNAKLTLRVMPGETADATLQTRQYAYLENYPQYYPISSIRLCLYVAG